MKPYDTEIEQLHWAIGDFATDMARAVRRARSAIPVHTQHQHALRDVGVGVAGPVLTCYVLWALERARARGAERVYFVARDGDILRRIAQRMPWATEGLELRYLYASRRALCGAALVPESMARQFEGFFDVDDLTLTRVFRRIGLDPQDFEDDLAGMGFRPESWSSAFGADSSPLETLQIDDVKEAARPHLAEHRRLTMAYLEQEGLLDATPKALVDLGWRGRQNQALAELLDSVGVPSPISFFLGVIPSQPLGFPYEGWLWGPESSSPLTGIAGLAQVLETFCFGVEGSVVAYRRPNGALAPVLGDYRAEAFEWGLPFFRTAVLRFAGELHSPAGSVPVQELHRVADILLESLVDTPTREEAEALGSFPFEAWDDGSVPLARALTTRDALRNGLRGARLDPSYWQAGSRARSNRIVPRVYRRARRARRLLRRSKAKAGR